jgi:hypothetical protein
MADFDPNAFNELAGELLHSLSGKPVADSGPDQARVRTAIGRSYYAAFLVARQRLRSNGDIIPAGGLQDHRLIVDALGGENSDLGSKLFRLRLRRNRADYNLSSSGYTMQAGQYWLDIASEIISEVRRLP